MQYQDFSWIQTAFQMNFLLNTPELSTACVHHGEGAHSFVPAGPSLHFGSSHMALISQLLKPTEFWDQEVLVLKFQNCRRAPSSGACPGDAGPRTIQHL